MTMFRLHSYSNRVCVIVLTALCALGHTGHVYAQTTATTGTTSDAQPRFVIKGFDIVGDNPLVNGEASDILAPYLRADASIETLQMATAALESALRKKGYALHRVVLPPQEVGSSVTLTIVKFVIGKISIEGAQRYDMDNIRASLPELVAGKSPNFQKLAIQTGIANESQGKHVQVGLKESEEPNKIDAHVIVTESKPWSLAVNESNTGSSATGNDRLTLTASHANLFNRDHQATLSYSTSLERLSDVRQFGLNYRIPLYQLGGVATVNYTHSDVLGDFGAFKSSGAGRTFGVGYNHYLPPDGGSRSYIGLGLDDKQFDVAKINDIPLAGQMTRRARPLTLGLNTRVDTDRASWNYNLDLVVNTTGGEGNDLTAYQSEDTRITNVNWKAVRGGANYLSALDNGWLWGLRTQFQWASDALISGEQFGLGGATSVRGTSERALAADNGLLLSTELTTRELAPGLRLRGFVDAGWLGNINPNGNPKPAHDALSSIGVGLRYTLSQLSVTADYGRLIAGSSQPYVAGSLLPQSGDQKLHVNVSARF